MFEIHVGDWILIEQTGDLPFLYGEYKRRARLVEEFDLDRDGGGLSFIAVGSKDSRWPEILIAQRYEPFESGFHPGCLVEPTTGKLFVGAGTRLLLYDLAAAERVWGSSTSVGFWGWRRHGDVVFMKAELELAAWSADGRRLWSTPTEPPWRYQVDGDVVLLDIMGERTRLDLATGATVQET